MIGENMIILPISDGYFVPPKNMHKTMIWMFRAVFFYKHTRLLLSTKSVDLDES